MGLIGKLIQQARARPWPDPPKSRARDFGRFVFLACAYVVVARLSLHLAVLPGWVSPLWPPAAIALCSCLVWGNRMLPAVWISEFLVLLTVGAPIPSAMLAATGVSVEAWAGSYLVQRLYRPTSDFIHSDTAFRFIAIAIATSLIGALFGTAAIALAGETQPTVLQLSWLSWWVGDATGMIIVAPLILAWDIRNGIQWRRSKVAEAVTFAVLLLATAQLAFGGHFGNWPLAYLTIPFFLWAAFRFNLATVAWTTATICAIAVWNTAQGNGPFASHDLNASLLLLMIYISVVGSMGLVLANLVYQHDITNHQLTAERDGLERHVHNRTAALLENIEGRKRIEERLAAREQQLEEAQQLAQIGSWNWDIESNSVACSDELFRIFGVDKDSFVVTSASVRTLIHPKDVSTLDRMIGEFRMNAAPFRTELRIRPPGRRERIVAARGQGAADDAGRIVRAFGTVQDVTEARIAEVLLREAEERYRRVVELSPDAILVQQGGLFMLANPAAIALLGADRVDRIVGQPVCAFLHPRFHDFASDSIARLHNGQASPTKELEFIRLDGRAVDVEVTSSAFLHAGGFATLLIMRDITERKKTAEQMAYLAHYDSLTGLPNRMLFLQRLEHALSIAQRPVRSLELLFLDLDRFKSINDTLGHAAGDLVLQETANRLQSTLRESDTVARLGGDEFVVLVENVDEPHRGSIIAEKILTAFAPPFMRDRNPLSVSTSIGISSYPDDGIDADTLLRNADIAMYHAKQTGRNSYRYFSAEMNAQAAERASLESALAHAIELDQLVLHYQPKIDMQTNRVTGMEALLRWQHPVMGAVPARQFIPVAEESGLINTIGYWTLRTACLQNKAWQQNSAARLRVAVNLSPRQLADDKLIENVGEILRDTELDPAYLELEITEAAVRTNPERAIDSLNCLRDMGITLTLDDFGTGYSSLSDLRRFPIRTMKIDSSFVQGVPFNHNDASITKAIINLAHSFECSVIAEGAETQQQYDFLREHHCDSVQGHYFSEAMPAENFGDLIRVQSNLHLH